MEQKPRRRPSDDETRGQRAWKLGVYCSTMDMDGLLYYVVVAVGITVYFKVVQLTIKQGCCSFCKQFNYVM